MNVTKFNFTLLVALAGLLINSAYAGNQQEEKLSADVQTSLHSAIINPIQPHLVFSDKEKAAAWLSDMSNRLKSVAPKDPLVQDEFMRKRLLTTIQYESIRAGLDPQLVLSLITVESRFNKYAISSAGARGIMQVMPFWQRQIGARDQDLLNVQTNIRFGCTILRHYLQLEHGDMFMALGRYNGSRGQATYPNLVFGALNRYWQPATVMMMAKNGELKSVNYAVN
ncbi:MAG TPA: transglycosylase [Neisseriales bacterium]|jgi:soluble lytic murein transglycosylase-like protein|nr:transglycosylase SLT domain-containing protein [Burkholderiales bacterium]MBP9767980.1 transglycosylase SLT domain-containing protein [Burkholderiales bacterium]HCY39494.1 transglycosylase [Neisseriales bacterium]